ncbi:TPA: hypothetical protein I8Y21_003933 [Klebsiella oxytoca]|uniref:Uncharacterized protein n=1 Tax=Klebsiella oxytoca TaxID=571 RepID=A0AAN5REY6_KLEOX|nr:hypothetical protein [Klebsiella oxytoca]
MNIFIKKLLNAVLPDPQPDHCDDDDNPLHITPIDLSIRPGFGRQYISNGTGDTELIHDE